MYFLENYVNAVWYSLVCQFCQILTNFSNRMRTQLFKIGRERSNVQLFWHIIQLRDWAKLNKFAPSSPILDRCWLGNFLQFKFEMNKHTYTYDSLVYMNMLVCNKWSFLFLPETGTSRFNIFFENKIFKKYGFSVPHVAVLDSTKSGMLSKKNKWNICWHEFNVILLSILRQN